mgnify:CR=1 FL=1
MFQEIIKIIILSISSIITLFILTKIMGNREMSQLTMFDYINSITIGSIAAEMSTSLESNFTQPLTAMIVYALFILLITVISSKSMRFRRFISGKSLVLYENEELYMNNFKKSRLDLSEFLGQCRTNGYFNLSDLQSVILEASGKLSFLPKSTKRPLTPDDMNLSPSQDKPLANVILDGKVLEKNLQSTGNNLTWLIKETKKQGFKNISDIFLATCDIDNNLTIYGKLPKKTSHSLFD